MKGLKKIKGKRGLDNLFPKSGKATPELPTLSSRAPSDKTGYPILNFAFFAKFRVGMLEPHPNQRGLVLQPQQWLWSSFRYYVYAERGPVSVNETQSAELRIRKIS